MKLVGTSVQLRHPEEADVSIILRWENDVANWLVSDTSIASGKCEIWGDVSEAVKNILTLKN